MSLYAYQPINRSTNRPQISLILAYRLMSLFAYDSINPSTHQPINT